MKYCVIKVSNGAFAIVSEWDKDREKAIVAYHDTCKTLWNSADVEKACVAILDENLMIQTGYIEYIKYTKQ